jgi:hypothetical protein
MRAVRGLIQVEGPSDATGAGHIKLFDSLTFEQIDSFVLFMVFRPFIGFRVPLLPFEFPSSLISLRFNDEADEYYAIGSS